MTATTVLFACVHNAGRSQMAAAWFNQLSDPAKARAISAGTDPGPHVHPEVVAAMHEAGLDLSGAPTCKLTTELAQRAQMLITMGCGDQCPVVPGLKRDDLGERGFTGAWWTVKNQRLNAVRFDGATERRAVEDQAERRLHGDGGGGVASAREERHLA